ncbi:hypothetical protein [Rhizobium sp. MHM7A]|uniref:hypothetical protein n=1 Tax=Rhizobium sp. MHM7A TaxID=2583233 RepID=UPI0011061B09|nr:hypothetical protein [Rhizobium sp. MHM7A]TLX16358.1 hypothetical protein FFR93_03230 [Rhizobium sp. MHM7A]
MKKPKQFKAESHVVDGRTVRFQEIPFKVRDYSFRNDKDGNPIPHPDERARYEVFIDEAHVANLSMPLGVGKQHFKIERLGKDYEGRYGDVVIWGFRFHPLAERLYTLEQAAHKIIEFRDTVRWGGYSVIPTLDELANHVREEKEQAARDQEQMEKYRAERRAEQKRFEEEAERIRTETLEGLLSIRARFGSQLSNLELNALVKMIEQHTA